MVALSDSEDSVRKACTLNNHAWLASFGCELKEQSSCVRVWHDELIDFRALLVYREGGRIPRGTVKTLVDTAATDRLAVYLDAGIQDDWERELQIHGYRSTRTSWVRAADISGGDVLDRPLRLRMLKVSEAAKWVKLYTRIFAHSASNVDAQERRWQAAFSAPQLRHGLFERDGRVVGLCQLCISNAVAGLYGVGFLPSERDSRTLRRAARLVRAAARTEGVGLLYFERVRASIGAVSLPTSRPRIVRHFQIWIRS
jgi:hypothetical protein